MLQETSELFVILLSIPIFYFILQNGQIHGKRSKSYGKKWLFRTRESISHNILGVLIALASTKGIKLPLKDRSRRIVVLLLLISYPFYNLVKRVYRNGVRNFKNTSYFANLADLLFGFITTRLVLRLAGMKEDIEFSENEEKIVIASATILSATAQTMLLM
jgi:hypothetical protein